MVKPIHVGYVRWSSDPQEHGDSERRQRKSITDDTARIGVTISRWMQDEGLSASSGENILKGELGRFLQEVRDGKVPRGSVLYLDEPTRLTRLNPSKAMRILADLEDAGVAIRLSARGQTLSGDSLYELLGFLIESAAGHAFTRELGRKVHEAWSAKRSGARSAPGKEVLTSNTPFGITTSGGTYSVGKGWSGRRYAVQPQEASIIELIFTLARDGFSPRQIAIRLNTEGVQSPHAMRGKKCKTGKPAWRTETIRNLLHDRVYADGSYQPCRGTSKKGKKREGERVVGHYPVFLEEGLWEAANAELAKHRNPRRTTHRSGSSNLFTGLITCACCGGAVSLRSGKDGKRTATMFCINARVGTCKASHSIPRSTLEASVLNKLHSSISPETILNDLNQSHLVVDREAKIERLRGDVREREKDVTKLADRILALTDSANLDLFEERLSRGRQELAELRVILSEAEREREIAVAEITQNVRAATDFRGLVDMAVYGEPRAEFFGPVSDFAKAVKEAEGLESQLANKIEPARVKLKAALRRILKKVVLNVDTGWCVLTLQSGQCFRMSVNDDIDIQAESSARGRKGATTSVAVTPRV